MNDKIAWEVSPQHEAFLPSKQPEFIVESSLVEKLNGPRKEEWYKQFNDTRLANVDTSFFSKLAQYDHWDIHSSGPLGFLVKTKSDRISPWSIPVPNYFMLRALVKVRLLKGMRDRQLISALREVRHFAKLLYSQEIFSSPLVAISLLKEEKAAYQEGVRRGLIGSSDWSPLDEKTFPVAKRAIFAFAGFLDFRMSAAVLDKIFDSGSHVGLCSGVSESAANLMLSKAYLLEQFLVSKANKAQFEHLDRIFNKLKKNCRLTYAQYLLEDSERFFRMLYADSPADSRRFEWSNLRFKYGRHIPYYRRAVGLEFQSLAVPNFIVSRYGEQ